VICDGKSFDPDPRRCFSFRCVGSSAEYPSSRGIAPDRCPNAEVRVSFRIDAEAFFVEEPVSRTARLGREWPERVAA
jgi:hypothetical protein